jgi:hypothetical protein
MRQAACGKICGERLMLPLFSPYTPVNRADDMGLSLNRGALMRHVKRQDLATVMVVNFVEPLGDSSGMSVSRNRMPAER